MSSFHMKESFHILSSTSKIWSLTENFKCKRYLCYISAHFIYNNFHVIGHLYILKVLFLTFVTLLFSSFSSFLWVCLSVCLPACLCVFLCKCLPLFIYVFLSLFYGQFVLVIMFTLFAGSIRRQRQRQRNALFSSL